mmetsp:Transcript_4388/g.13939  ORF Transcript_4388/g.13939 Transcript_4388/m.13939 type:complete len:168 (-) Transcript_4388:2677-3180(-)
MASDADVEWMRVAIDESRRGDWPYGAVVVDADGKALATAHNTGAKDADPTCHAELNAIRQALAARVGDERGSLAGCTLYSSAESCPMCAAATVWAGIERSVFGATIGQLCAAGQDQIRVDFATICAAAQPWSRCTIQGGVLAEEAISVVRAWEARRVSEEGNAVVSG